jgi:hypothetical protein
MPRRTNPFIALVAKMHKLKIYIFLVTLGFFGRLRRVVKWYKEFCLSKAKERRAAELALRR